MISKICLNCGSPFDTEPEWNKDYCDVRCRLTAKRNREKLKAKTRKANSLTEPTITEIMNPSEMQLTTLAGLMLMKKDVTPRNFKGVVPVSWTPPDGISFEPDISERGRWTMMRSDGVTTNVQQEVSALDILNKLQ